jgi:hypothetical protein
MSLFKNVTAVLAKTREKERRQRERERERVILCPRAASGGGLDSTYMVVS